MSRCANCNTMMMGGYRAGDDRYCSLPCYTASPQGNFCEDCMDATTADSPGSTFMVNTVGTRMCFSRDRCPKCHSIVQRKAIVALYIPLIPLAKYRVIYVRGGRYVGRRLRSDRAQQPYSSAPIEPK
jgi:hypothetical protein